VAWKSGGRIKFRGIIFSGGMYLIIAVEGSVCEICEGDKFFIFIFRG